jgi:hypothetical protein
MRQGSNRPGAQVERRIKMAVPKQRKETNAMQRIDEIWNQIAQYGVVDREDLQVALIKAAQEDYSLVGINLTQVCNGLLEQFLRHRKPDFSQPGLSWYQEKCLIPCGEHTGDKQEHLWVELGWATKKHLENYRLICRHEFQASMFIQDKRENDFQFLDKWDGRRYRHFRDFRNDNPDLFE